MSTYHQPVLEKEVLRLLEPAPGKRYIDATIGGGGHTQALLEQGATVLGIDQDPDALEYIKNKTTTNYDHLQLVEGNFNNIGTIATDHGFTAVDGVLFDLGVSSHQLNTPERGFSFTHSAPLDMRMSPQLAVTAADLVNGLGRKELYELFTKYAQEEHARKIADAIISARRLSPITTTDELADIVASVKMRRGHLHPATKVFQALRIAVNDELNSLSEALEPAFALLAANSTLVIISFHQGEDKIVKNFIRHIVQQGRGEPLTQKPITPSSNETSHNPRARSAKLRAIKKIN